LRNFDENELLTTFDEDLTVATATLRHLERFWIRAGDLVKQPGRRIA
jgi:hypothetical protein